MATIVGPVVYSIEVNGTLQQEYPTQIRLRQRWGEHELFFLTMKVPMNHSYKGSLAAWPDNAAVKVTWGRAPANVGTWYGYVNHHTLSTTDENGYHILNINYVLIGTSKVMNSDRSRAWQNMTPSTIARKIAREYSFRSVITTIDWVLPFEMQAGESDFAFLNRIADKVGFKFWVSGGTLYFVEPTVLLQGASSYAVPTYRSDQYPAMADTAINFRVNQGDNLPGGVIANRKMSGITSTGNGGYRAFEIQADLAPNNSVDIFNPDRFTTSRDEARRLVNATQTLGQFWIEGSVDVFGLTLLYPGKLIDLEGHALANNNQGYWLISGVEHTLANSFTKNTANDIYVTHVEIMKNTKNRIPDIKGVHKVVPETIECFLVNNVWHARSLATITEGVIST